MIAPNHARTVAGLDPAPAMYLFTGETNVQRKRRERYGHSGTGYLDLPPVTVTVLATDQADAERIVAEMLSTPADTPEGGYGDYVDTYTRHYAWTRVEQAPQDAAALETTRQELADTIALLDEAQSAGRLAMQQAEAEREHADQALCAIGRVYALIEAASEKAVAADVVDEFAPVPVGDLRRALAPEGVTA